MTDNSFFPVKPEIAAAAHVNAEAYARMYEQSVKDPEAFWASRASGSTGSSLTAR